LVLNPGDKSLKEMIREMKDGVIVYNVIGGGQSNLLAGDFSLNLGLAYKVENGEIVGRVKDSMVAGNVYTLLRDHLVAVGDQIEEHGQYYLPALCFQDLPVVSKEG